MNHNSAASFFCYLLLFVDFHFEFLSLSYLPSYQSYKRDPAYTDETHRGDVHKTITLLPLFFELLPFVVFQFGLFVRTITSELYKVST